MLSGSISRVVWGGSCRDSVWNIWSLSVWSRCTNTLTTSDQCSSDFYSAPFQDLIKRSCLVLRSDILVCSSADPEVRTLLRSTHSAQSAPTEWFWRRSDQCGWLDWPAQISTGGHAASDASHRFVTNTWRPQYWVSCVYFWFLLEVQMLCQYPRAVRKFWSKSSKWHSRWKWWYYSSYQRRSGVLAWVDESWHSHPWASWRALHPLSSSPGTWACYRGQVPLLFFRTYRALWWKWSESQCQATAAHFDLPARKFSAFHSTCHTECNTATWS